MKLTSPAGLVAAGLVAVVAAGGIYVTAGGPLPHAVNTGPLGSGGNTVLAASCSPTGFTNQVLTDGGDVVFQDKGPAAVIDKVSISNPRRLVLLAAYTVPITGHELFGTWRGFPSPADVSTGVHWAQRQRANGARISHSPGIHDVTDLVLVLKRLGKTGTTDGVDIYYHSSGQNYHFSQHTRIILVAGITCPSPSR